VVVTKAKSRGRSRAALGRRWHPLDMTKAKRHDALEDYRRRFFTGLGSKRKLSAGLRLYVLDVVLEMVEAVQSAFRAPFDESGKEDGLAFTLRKRIRRLNRAFGRPVVPCEHDEARSWPLWLSYADFLEDVRRRSILTSGRTHPSAEPLMNVIAQLLEMTKLVEGTLQRCSSTHVNKSHATWLLMSLKKSMQSVEDTLAPLIPRKEQRRRTISARRRFEVLRRDGFACHYCGIAQADGAVLELDHKLSVSRGGTDSFENLVTACRECNLGKTDRSIQSLRRSSRVPRQRQRSGP